MSKYGLIQYKKSYSLWKIIGYSDETNMVQRQLEFFILEDNKNMGCNCKDSYLQKNTIGVNTFYTAARDRKVNQQTSFNFS